MSKERNLRMSSSIIQDDGSGVDGDGRVQLHGVHKFKNVLYYKKHSIKAIPTKGTMKLAQKTLSFQSRGLDYAWDLDSIRVERFKGRVNGGIKIYGQQQKGGSTGEGENEFTFTMVKQRSYDMICNSIDEAKFDSEMMIVRRASMETISSANKGDLSRTLKAGGSVGDKRSLLPKPLRFIMLGIFRLVSFIFKIFTGRRLWGPKNMHHALHGVLSKVNPILKVSRMSLPPRTVMAITKDVDSIHNSLVVMQRITQRQQSAFLSSGTIADHSGNFLDRSGIFGASYYVGFYLSFFFFSIRRALNLPVYRWTLVESYQPPSTVCEAVQQANDQLEALMELTVTEKYSSEAISTILGEAKDIQMLLYNITVHSKGAQASSSTKKE